MYICIYTYIICCEFHLVNRRLYIPLFLFDIISGYVRLQSREWNTYDNKW